MAEKSFLRENAVPIIVTLLVLGVGTYILLQQGYFANASGMGGSMIVKNLQLKLFIEEDGVALVGYAPSEYLMDYRAFAGNQAPGPGEMVLGFTEAGMMAEEDNLTFNQVLWGFEADEEFAGGEINVTGVLEKTGTILDMAHIVSKGTFDAINSPKIITKFTEEGMPKFFYIIDNSESNWPPGTEFAVGSKTDFVIRNIGGKPYYPVVLGSGEAKMMISEKLISGVGAKIDGFFGRDSYIVGILEPTNSSLDMLHFIYEG
jgi:hypothetical protein